MRPEIHRFFDKTREIHNLTAAVARIFWKTRGIWTTTPAVAGMVILLRCSGALQNWEWETYDLYTRWRPPEPVDRRILIVGIDEKDVSDLGDSIVPDGLFAELLRKIQAGQPRSIGMDIYRNVPVPPGTKELETVFQTTPNLVGIQKVVGQPGVEAVPPSKTLKARGQVGANDLPIDADNRVRRGLLYLEDKNEKDRDRKTVYSFSLHLAGLYLAAEGIVPEAIPETDRWRIGKGVFVPFEANDGGYVRADAGGFQFLINYRANKRAFERVSMTDILQDRVPPDLLRGRVVLIGKVGESFKDVFSTPYSSELGFSRQIPGVEIQASIVSQIISAALDGRPASIRSWPEWADWLWILLWSGIGAGISWQFRYSEGKKYSLPLRWIVGLVAGGTLFGITYGAFLYGWWIPSVPPFLALTGSAIAITAYIARTAASIRNTFGRYLTAEVVENILENPTGSRLGGERREITILTSDLRGFTATAERVPPERVIQILNVYLARMADVIVKYRGTIDEFMGDGILVLFGAPTRNEDDAVRALACAVEMQLAMEEVNHQMKEWGFAPLEMGIGINTGEVVVGNIGSEKRAKYGVVGSQVNLTYRIESYTTGGQILISETTLRKVGDLAIVTGHQEVQLKGVKQPITIYNVDGIGDPYSLRLNREEESFFPLLEAIPVRYSLLEGKHIVETRYLGNLVQLSIKGAEVKGAEVLPDPDREGNPPPRFTNLKLNFSRTDLSSELNEDIYAKVLDRLGNNGSFYIQFTNVPLPIESYLNSLYLAIKNTQDNNSS